MKCTNAGYQAVHVIFPEACDELGANVRRGSVGNYACEMNVSSTIVEDDAGKGSRGIRNESSRWNLRRVTAVVHDRVETYVENEGFPNWESTRNWRQKAIRKAMAARGKQHGILRVAQVRRRNFKDYRQTALF